MANNVAVTVVILLYSYKLGMLGKRSPCANEWQSLLDQTVQRRQRAEARHPASGEVRVLLYEELGMIPAIVEGQLLDVSSRGCKVRHSFGHVKPGQHVTLLVDAEELEAKVMWTKSLVEYHESGFSFVRR